MLNHMLEVADRSTRRVRLLIVISEDRVTVLLVCAASGERVGDIHEFGPRQLLRVVPFAVISLGDDGAAVGVEDVFVGGEEVVGGAGRRRGFFVVGGPSVQVIGFEAVVEEVLVEVWVGGTGVVEACFVVGVEEGEAVGAVAGVRVGEGGLEGFPVGETFGAAGFVIAAYVVVFLLVAWGRVAGDG